MGTVHSLFIADSVAGNAGSARRHSQGQTELKDSLPPVSGGISALGIDSGRITVVSASSLILAFAVFHELMALLRGTSD